MNDGTLLMPERAVLGPDGQKVSVVGGAPPFDKEEDAKAFIFEKLGDLADIRLLFNEVLVAKYIRRKVSEHLAASSETEQLDVWQGVVGLVLKVGPTAFRDDDATKFPWDAWIAAGYVTKPGDCPIRRGDWVLYRHSDGWDKDIRALSEYAAFKCRALQDAHIRGIVDYPGRWF